MKAYQHYLEIICVRNIAVMAITIFFYSLTFYTTTFTLFLTQRGFTYLEIFLLESILSLAIVACEVPSGVLADRIGRKKLLVCAVFLYAASTYMIAFSHTYVWFVLESVLYGIGVALMSGTDSAFLYESLQQQKKTHLSTYSFSVTSLAEKVGMLISLPFGGILAAYSLELPVYASLVSLTIAVFCSLLLTESRRKGEQTARNIAKKSFFLIWRAHPLLLSLEGLRSVVSVSAFSLLYLNQPYFLQQGIPVATIGLIMLGVQLLSAVALLTVPFLREKLTYSLLFIFTSLIPGCLFMVLALIPSIKLGILAIALIIGCNEMKRPVYRTLLNEQIQVNERATILSMISFVGSLVGMCLKPVIGYLADFDLPTAFLVMGMILILLTPVTWLIVYKIDAKTERSLLKRA